MFRGSINPKVSIVIPAYNAANYLSKAIESALGQSYGNIEVIVVNDGSTDNGQTGAVANRYGDRIRYFCKPNGGVSSAMNYGLSKMSGEYFSWLSHDDLYSKTKIEEAVAFFNLHPDAKVCYCNFALINAQGKMIRVQSMASMVLDNWADAMKTNVDVSSMTIHRQCFDKAGAFDERNSTTQDWQMIMQLSRHFPFYPNDGSYIYKRLHEDMGSIAFKPQVKLDLVYLIKFMQENGYFSDELLNGGDRIRKVNAMEWLGDVYKNCNDYEKADRYYEEGYVFGCWPFHTITVKHFLGARIVNALPLRKVKQFMWLVLSLIKWKG